MSHLVASEYKCFEDIRRTRPDGSEYWCARELAPVLDYAKWENFAKVIKRAMIACENSGHDTAADFPEVRKIVKAGATTKSIVDYELSRYACYLIVQNGDPRKEVIALGQTYFAIQTYRQEVADRFNQLDEDSRRLVVRGDMRKSSPFRSPLEKAPGTFSHTINRGRIWIPARPRDLSAFRISFTSLTCSIKRPERAPDNPALAPATDKS